MKAGSGLLARFREMAAMKNRSENTVETYTTWLMLFWKHVGKKPAGQWRPSDVSAFLRWMGTVKPAYAGVSRRNALCALKFVFDHVLKVDLGDLNLPEMPRAKKRLKIIPNREEIAEIIGRMRGQRKLIAALMYGAGTRVEETCKLRVKDIDIAALTIRIHDGKGGKDGLVQLPASLVPWLERQLAWRKALHEQDVADGCGLVDLPGRYGMKDRGAARSLDWQFLFASHVKRGLYRYHITPQAVQQALKTAKAQTGITKRITPHTLRSAHATHALRIAGNDIDIVQRNLRHADVRTTMLYIGADGAVGHSPLDVPFAERPGRAALVVPVRQPQLTIA